jgi:hypothetical protein
MNPDRAEFLKLVTLPARLNVTETSWYLGFNEPDISVLAADRLVKPLGHPPASGSKFYALAELQRLRNDPKWLAKASDAVVNYWKMKNASRVGLGKA